MVEDANRLVRACDDANGRLQAAVGTLLGAATSGDATDLVFAPLGETLMWIAARDELLWHMDGYKQRRDADHNGAVLLGLRLARNAVVHGAVLFQVVRVDGVGMYPFGQCAFGRLAFSADLRRCVWVPRTSFLAGPRTESRPKQEVNYDAHVAGRELLSSLGQATTFLASEGA